MDALIISYFFAAFFKILIKNYPSFVDHFQVDSDRRNPLPPSGGQDSVPSVGAHAALLSAANAGTGYTAFA